MLILSLQSKLVARLLKPLIVPEFFFIFCSKRTVAIVVPSKAHVEALANRIGMATESFEQLCSNTKACKAVLNEINASGSQAG